MTLEKAKQELENFVQLKTTLRPSFVDVLLNAEEVKHGHWELSPFDGNWTCSRCGDKPYHSNMKNMNYCPNCGAKMDGENR